jgi:hypothetical protein
MANISVNVVNQNNVAIEVVPPTQNTINLTPPATQTISIDRGLIGPPGPPGPNEIGGYPITLGGTPNNYDALMFNSGVWTNIPQVEITDGGNF